MRLVPGLANRVVHTALPALSSTAPHLAITVPALRKATVPPAGRGVTVALNRTAVVATGRADDVTAVVVDRDVAAVDGVVVSATPPRASAAATATGNKRMGVPNRSG